MTGYQSKKAMAQAKVEGPLHVVCQCDKCKAQPALEPVAWMSEEDNCIFFGADKPNPMDYDFWTPLYTTPPQRTWVEPTGNEWFEWWRISKVADATEAEIDFADFLIIAQAVSAKLKEKNT